MKQENIILKIWRVIYPVGIYFVISNAISIAYIMVQGILLYMGRMRAQESIDILSLQQDLYTILYRDSMTLTAISAVITIPIAIMLVRKDWKKENVRYEKPNPVLYGLVIVVAFTACVGANQLITISRLSELFPGFNRVQEAIYGGGIIMEIIAAVILAPIIEELLFRRLVFKRLCDYIGKMSAMLLSSLFFGIYHGNMVQGIYAFFIGMMLVFVYDKYKTIVAPIIAHMVANLTSVLMVETSLFDGLYDRLYDKNHVFYLSTIVVVAICFSTLAIINMKVVSRQVSE